MIPCRASAMLSERWKKFCSGVRIGKQVGAVLRQFGAEVGAVEAGEPERVGGDGGIGPADHFEFEVGDDGGQRHGRVGEEAGVAEAAKLFRAEEREDDGAARARARGERVGQGEHGGGAGGVVVGAVVDAIAGGVGWADAEVIEVRGQQDDLAGGIAAAEDGDGVPGLGAGGVFKTGKMLLHRWRQRRRQGDPLHEAAVVATRLEAERLELSSGKERRDVLVAGRRAAAVQFVVGEKRHVRPDFAVERRIFRARRRCRLARAGVE